MFFICRGSHFCKRPAGIPQFAFWEKSGKIQCVPGAGNESAFAGNTVDFRWDCIGFYHQISCDRGKELPLPGEGCGTRNVADIAAYGNITDKKLRTFSSGKSNGDFCSFAFGTVDDFNFEQDFFPILG